MKIIKLREVYWGYLSAGERGVYLRAFSAVLHLFENRVYLEPDNLEILGDLFTLLAK